MSFKSIPFYSQNEILPVSTNLLVNLDAFSSYPGTGTTWNDLSGNGNNATLVNGPTFSALDPKFIGFDGVDDYATIPSLNLQRDFSIEFMLFINRNDNFCISQGTVNTSRFLHAGSYPSSTNNIVFFNFYSNDALYTLNSTTMDVNKWQHWIFTYNDTTFLKRFYLNGVLRTQDAGSVNNRYLTNTGIVYLALQVGSSNTGNGKFAWVRIYNKVLSQSEVTQNYDYAKNIFGSLMQ